MYPLALPLRVALHLYALGARARSSVQITGDVTEICSDRARALQFFEGGDDFSFKTPLLDCETIPMTDEPRTTDRISLRLKGLRTVAFETIDQRQ